MSDECPAHWQGTRRLFWHDSMMVMRSEAELQGAWEALAASCPDGDSRATNADMKSGVMTVEIVWSWWLHIYVSGTGLG